MKTILLILSFIISIFIQAQDVGITITEVANMPMAISNNAVVEGWANDTGYVFSFGGIDSTKIWSGINKKSFRYNTVTDVWDTIPDLPNANAVIASGASYVDSIIYIMGGYQVLSNGNEVSSNIVNRYDPRTNTYLSDGANIPLAIDDHVQAVYKDSLIYLITGWSNTGNFPNVQIYDPLNNNWLTGTPVPNNNTYKAFGASGVISGSTIYYHGGASTGFNFPGQSNMRVGQINPTDPTQITWTNTPTTETTYRSACTDLSGFVYWIGGSEITYNFNGIAYNGTGGVEPRVQFFASSSLTPFQSLGSSNLPMDLRGIASIENSLALNGESDKYIAGGMESGQKVSNKTFLLDLTITVGINEKNTSNSFKIYPNPSSQEINLVFEKTENRVIQLVDIVGKEVFNTESDKLSLQIDVSDYPKGIYFIEVETDKGSSSQKIVVQ